MSAATDVTRCGWCGDDPLYCRYHDEEWGVPQRDGRVLFEKLCLEGLQAGLSWITILRRRDDLRIAFDGFEPERLAAWTDEDRLAVLDRPGVIRHRGKIEAICGNARAVIGEFEGLDDFSRFVWSFAPAPDAERRRPETTDDLATETVESRRLAKALKARGFRFIGPVSAHAFMQSMGLVDDHLVGCHRATS
ncbi:MAG: DNA-3-methyladenine glycosylase I [Phycisphaerales bacterium]|nr:DNA-3-methyladenine glycosylase I [Phycisphaerales bacterium]